MRYLFGLVITFLLSCSEDVKMDPRYMISKAYLNQEKIAFIDLDPDRIDYIIDDISTTVSITEDIYLSKIIYQYGDCFVPSGKLLIYIQSKEKRFEYAFGFDDNTCFNRIRVVGCNEPIFRSKLYRCVNNIQLQENLNYVFKRLGVNSVKTANKIVNSILHSNIKTEEEFQLYLTYDNLANESQYKDIKPCCLKALKEFRKIHMNELYQENIRFFQTGHRGIWRIKYFLKNNIVSIETKYFLAECIKVHPLGFSSYKSKKNR